MVWPFRRRKTGRHRLVSSQVGVVLPGVALAAHDGVDLPAGLAACPGSADTAQPDGRLFQAVRSVVPAQRAHREPEIMPLPARVVLCFEDGSTRIVTPLSDEAERMRATAERLMGVDGEPARAARPGLAAG